MIRFSRIAAPAMATVCLLAGSVRAEKAVPTFDQAVREQAPKVLAALKAKGYKNVGVLKFLARHEGGSWRDNLGPVNRTVADRLEVALLLALKPSDNMGILFRASETIAKSDNMRANHRTAEGRAEFFSFDPSPFSLPWNRKELVQPDAFLTGEITLSGDLRRMTVKVQVFGNRGDDKLKLVDVG